MGLLAEHTEKVFDASEIKEGSLIYAKHVSWDEPKTGIVTGVKENEIKVVFQQKPLEMLNFFHIPSKEVADGEWIIRWSEDLDYINYYPESLE